MDAPASPPVDLAEPLADDDQSISDQDSSEEEIDERRILNEQVVAMSTVLISGKGSSTKVHLCDPDDTGEGHTMAVGCGSTLHRASAYTEIAQHFAMREREPCPKCKPKSLPDLEAILW